jgi:hypothetical protein
MYSAHVQWYASYPLANAGIPMPRREELFEREDTLDFDVRFWGSCGLISTLRTLGWVGGSASRFRNS